MRFQRTLLVLGVLALIAVVAAVLAWPRPGPATATGGNTSITLPDTAGGAGQLPNPRLASMPAAINWGQWL